MIRFFRYGYWKLSTICDICNMKIPNHNEACIEHFARFHIDIINFDKHKIFNDNYTVRLLEK